MNPIDTTTPASLPTFTVSPEYAAAQAPQAKQAAQAAQAAQGVKPGIATTEFWLHVMALAIPLVLQAAGQSQNVMAIAAAQVAASLYTLARTWIKAR